MQTKPFTCKTHRLAALCVMLLCSLAGVTAALPCTTFVLQDQGKVYFGRNLDWFWQQGWIIINPRNIKKSSLVGPGNQPVRWTAKYGSVTFNQFGREMPFGGMNEAGLVVENMWLTETQYPTPDSRPAVNLLQWIQYQLDNCRTVDEVLATDKSIRLEAPAFNACIHYLVTDAQGDTASIEVLNGKLVFHRGKQLPFRALANDTYEKSVAYARGRSETEETSNTPGDKSSLARFSRAARCAAKFTASGSANDRKYAFSALDQVSQGDFTVWSIVYDISARQIHYRTKDNPRERVVDLKSLDFACGPARFVDIQANPSASGAFEFQELTEEIHSKYFRAFLALPDLKEKFGDLTPQMLGQLRMLRGFTCVDQK